MSRSTLKALASLCAPALLVGCLSLCHTRAQAQFLIRIGDADGFGYQTAPGFHAANGGFANRDGLGILGSGDLLPDINRDGHVATGNGDDFDLRTPNEIANNAVTEGVGVTNTGTLGSKFTDIALSTSYDASAAAKRVLIGGNPTTGLIFGAGGPFPSPPSSSLPNQPGFVFRFHVDKNALSSSSAIFFNLIFGDYDVLPADIQLTQANGSKRVLSLQQQDNTTSDGLIQAATATLNFGDVFTDSGSVWNGSLNVDFIAPNEPYTAFDYVELSTIPLVVPEPGSIALLLAGGLSGAGWLLRRHRKYLLSILALLVGGASATNADPIPYPNPGTQAPLTLAGNQLKGIGTDVIAYFDGTGANFSEQVGLYVNGVLTPAGFVFPNHDTSIGTRIDLGFASAGADLVFGVQVYDARLGVFPTGITRTGTGNLHYTGPFSYTIYSTPSDATYGFTNPGGGNQTYITAFTSADVSAAIPVTGTYVGFEDLLANGTSGRPSDFNYTDEQFVFTGISVLSVPEPGPIALLMAGLMGGSLLLRRRK